ncbi:MAG: sensor histidine kinase, partial [Candidatus Dormibacteraceae bacterium]
LQSSRVTLNLDLIDINQILRSAAQRGAASAPGHDFVLDLDGSLPHIRADFDRITQVVANLVSNAIKYSPGAGQIQIQSRLGNASVRATVTDQGVGIKSADLERVFSRYERVDAGPAQKVVGTGLGLPITREILNLHHGRIWVESEVGAGSTFHFELPLQ